MIRTFSSKGDLTELFYQDIRKTGHIWMNKNQNFKYLIYTNQGSFVNDNESNNGEPDTVVVPFDAKEDIVVGTIDLINGYLENVHQAEVDIVPSSRNYCTLELTWTLGKKEDFILYYYNETKVSLKNTSFCNQAQ